MALYLFVYIFFFCFSFGSLYHLILYIRILYTHVIYTQQALRVSYTLYHDILWRTTYLIKHIQPEKEKWRQSLPVETFSNIFRLVPPILSVYSTDSWFKYIPLLSLKIIKPVTSSCNIFRIIYYTNDTYNTCRRILSWSFFKHLR